MRRRAVTSACWSTRLVRERMDLRLGPCMSIAVVRTTVFARDACEPRIGAMLLSILCNVDRVVYFLLNSSTKGAFMDALHKSRVVQRVPPRNGYSREWGFRRNIFARNQVGGL